MEILPILLCFLNLFLNFVSLTLGGSANIYIIHHMIRVPAVGRKHILVTNLLVTSFLICLILVPLDQAAILQDLAVLCLGWDKVIPAKLYIIPSMLWTILEAVFATTAAGLAVHHLNVVKSGFTGGNVRSGFLQKVMTQRVFLLSSWVLAALFAIPGLTLSVMVTVKDVYYDIYYYTALVSNWYFLVLFVASVVITVVSYTKVVLFVREKGNAVVLGFSTPVSLRRSIVHGRSSTDTTSNEQRPSERKPTVIQVPTLDDIVSITNCLSRLSEVEATLCESTSAELSSSQLSHRDSLDISHIVQTTQTSMVASSSVLPGCTDHCDACDDLPILTPLLISSTSVLGTCLVTVDSAEEVTDDIMDTQPESAGAASLFSIPRSRISACSFQYPVFALGKLPTSPGGKTLFDTHLSLLSIPSTVSTLSLPRSISMEQASTTDLSRNSVSSVRSSRRSFLLISPHGSFCHRPSQVGGDLQSVYEQPFEGESIQGSSTQQEPSRNMISQTKFIAECTEHQLSNNCSFGPSSLDLSHISGRQEGPLLEERVAPDQEVLQKSNSLKRSEGNTPVMKSHTDPYTAAGEIPRPCSMALQSRAVQKKSTRHSNKSKRSFHHKTSTASSSKRSLGCQTDISMEQNVDGTYLNKDTPSAFSGSKRQLNSIKDSGPAYSHVQYSYSSGQEIRNSSESTDTMKMSALQKRRLSRNRKRKRRKSKNAWTNDDSASSFQDFQPNTWRREATCQAPEKIEMKEMNQRKSSEGRTQKISTVTIKGTSDVHRSRGRKYRVNSVHPHSSTTSDTTSAGFRSSNARDSLTVPTSRHMSVNTTGSNQISPSPSNESGLLSITTSPLHVRDILQSLASLTQLPHQEIAPRNKTLTTTRRCAGICLSLFLLLLPHVVVMLLTLTGNTTKDHLMQSAACFFGRAVASLLFALCPFLYILDNKSIRKMLKLGKNKNNIPLIHVM